MFMEQRTSPSINDGRKRKRSCIRLGDVGLILTLKKNSAKWLAMRSFPGKAIDTRCRGLTPDNRFGYVIGLARSRCTMEVSVLLSMLEYRANITSSHCRNITRAFLWEHHSRQRFWFTSDKPHRLWRFVLWPRMRALLEVFNDNNRTSTVGTVRTGAEGD